MKAKEVDITILIDENITRIDKKMIRVSHCAIELSDISILDEIRAIVPSLRADTIRFGNIKKFHFTELSEGQRAAVTDIISKIDVTAKMYTYYMFNQTEKQAKISTVIRTIGHLKFLHRTKNVSIMLEEAEEYKSETSLKPLLVSDESLFIVCDGFLAIYLANLDNLGGQSGGFDRMHTLIKEKIRLQVFGDSSSSLYLSGTNRI